MKVLVLMSVLGSALAAPAATGEAAAAPTVYGPWVGPMAATIGAGVNGQIIPVSATLEVQNAINAFDVEYNNALRRTGNAHLIPPTPAPIPADPRWYGPLATIILTGPDAGKVAETAEVAAATAAFRAAFDAAVLRNTPPAAADASAVDADATADAVDAPETAAV